MAAAGCVQLILREVQRGVGLGAAKVTMMNRAGRYLRVGFEFRRARTIEKVAASDQLSRRAV